LGARGGCGGGGIGHRLASRPGDRDVGEPRIATLNEGFLAAAVVTPFVVLRRPVRWAGAVGLALLRAIVVFN
jgi:hypothetical protein